jgi:hypothetical protein
VDSSASQTARPDSAYAVQWRLLCDVIRRRNGAEQLFGLERIFCTLLCLLLLFMPATLIREVGGRFGAMPRKLAIEAWVLARPIGLAIVLWHFAGAPAVPWLAGLALLDLYLYLFGVLFLARIPALPLRSRRSLLLLGINFADVVLSFALLYAHCSVIRSSSGETVTAPGALVFFSLVTAATVGFGDLVPQGGLGRGLVSLQIAASVVFLSVFISKAVGRVGASPAE